MNSGPTYSSPKSWCTLCNSVNQTIKINYEEIHLCKTCRLTLDISNEDIINYEKKIIKDTKMITFGKSKKILIKKTTFKRIKNHIVSVRKNHKSVSNRKLREIKLMDKLQEEKLDYVSHSICDTFIRYGMPELNEVIDTLKKNTMTKSENLIKLSNELSKNNIQYDESIPRYANYVNSGKNLADTIYYGNIERIVIDKTNYLKYLKTESAEDALDMACIEYIEREGHHPDITKYLEDITTIKFV